MNDANCHYTQYKCRPYVCGETQTSNCKALLTEPLRPLFMDKKTEQGAYRFLQLLELAGFDRQKKIKIENPIAGERRGAGGGWARQLRSHVNTNTNLREEENTVHCSRKRVFHIMDKKNEGIRIFFS